jgi:opacity protein-like surface antigen
MAMDNVLPYVTAGIASTEYFGELVGSSEGTVRETHAVLGAGVEYGVTDTLRVRFEGLYFLDPGVIDYAGADCCDLDNNEYGVVRLGVVWAF